jgi:hypothetical protein
VFSQSWFATVQDVLQADWHEAWHSPQPLPAVSLRLGLASVFICFISLLLLLLGVHAIFAHLGTRTRSGQS